jgi:hypothetical protein
MNETYNYEMAQTWASDEALRAPIMELNAEILATRIGAAPDFRGQWSALDGAARQRLAHCPFLLVDAGFARLQLWGGLPDMGVHEASPPRSPQASTPLSTPLLRRVLLLAWHMARSNRAGARVALGMSASCASVLADYRLADLEALAERRPAWIRLRWEQQAGVWRAWLSAAAQPSPRGIERLQLWGLQTLAAEVRRRAD